MLNATSNSSAALAAELRAAKPAIAAAAPAVSLAKVAPPAAAPKPAAPAGQLLAIDTVRPDPAQPRREFDPKALQELADSIRAEGLLQPVVVRPNGTGHVIVAGERRWRAAKLAGLKELSVIVRADLKDQDVSALQLVENLQRADLTLPEQCTAVAKLVKAVGFKDACIKLGKSDAWVSKRNALQTAPAQVQELVAKGHIVDLEIAGGLTQLIDLDKERAKNAIDQIKKPDGWQGAMTREIMADEVKEAKDEQKWAKEREAQRAAEASARKAGGKSGAAKDPHREAQRKEAEQKKSRLARWKIVLPLCEKFATAAEKATNLEITPPRVSDWHPDPVPASVESAEFGFRAEGDATALVQIASKTGLTLKLGLARHLECTPEQARKVEQAMGGKLRWTTQYGGRLNGKQLAAAAAKSGTKLEIPELPKVEAKPAAAAKPKAKAKPAGAKKPAAKATKKKARK